MICPNCGHYCADPPKYRISDERIEELWVESGRHMHRFFDLLLKEING